MNVSRIPLFIYFIGFVDLAGSSLIIPLLILQIREISKSHIIAGAVSSIYGILQLITCPLMGRWSDISGRRPVILSCMAATAVSYSILGSSQSLVIIILSRVIAGTFKHSQTLCKAVLADVTQPEDRSRVFGIFNATSSIGFIIGPILGGHLSELDNGFFFVCNIAAVFFLVDLVIFWMFIPEITRKTANYSKETFEGENLKQMFAFTRDIDWNIFGDIFLIRFCLSFSSMIYRSNFSLLIDQHFGVSPKVIGYLISFQGIIGAVAGFFTGKVSNYYKNSEKELFHSSSLLTLSIIGLTLAPSLPVLLLCLIPLCTSTALIRVSSSAIIIARCNPSKIGSVSGFGQSISSIARMVTPLIAGVTQDISVYGPGVVGASSAGVGALLAGYMVHKTKVRSY